MVWYISLNIHPVQVVWEGLVLGVLSVELRVVPEHGSYLPLQGSVVFNLCVLPVRVHLRSGCRYSIRLPPVAAESSRSPLFPRLPSLLVSLTR